MTGASAGIGAGFCHRLASRGVNVVLIARSVDKMQAISKEITSKYGIETLIIPFDFNSATSTDWTSIKDQLSTLNPVILVNNVGVNVEHPTEFLDMSQEDIDWITNINISSTNKMTYMLLPQMKASATGIILNLSSGGGVLTPSPLLSPYAGTKAYNDSFALSLAGEVPTGVHVHSLTPFFVESAMAKMRKSFTVPSADSFAEMALRCVGSGVRLQPYWVHDIMGLALGYVPLRLRVWGVGRLHRDIRKRALRKKERLAKQN